MVPAIAEEASGPSYSVTRLCAELVDQGQDVTLAALDWAPSASASAPAFVKTFSLGIGPRRLGLSPAMWRWLSTAAKTGEVELIHNHSLWMIPNVYPGWVSRRSGVPLVVSPRGTLSEWAFSSGSKAKKAFWPLLQQPALGATTCFHATAMSEYEDIRRKGFRQPIAVIPNGVDIPPAGQMTATPRRTLLFLGRIHKNKGLDMLLSAWRVLHERFADWDLKIAGPDNQGYLAEMKSLAERLRLQRVEFVGPVYGEAKWQMYRDSDLFVLPTYSENFGMSVAESLAAGTPAVVTNGAPWQGLETHEAGGWIDIGVDPLVAALEELMARSPEDLAAMGVRGREWMINEFSWRGIAEKTMEMYQWLASGGERPSFVLDN